MATRAELKARLSLDAALFERGIALAHSSTAKLGTTFTSIGSAGSAIFGKLAALAAAVGGVTGFALATKNAYELGESLTNLSNRTGIAVGRLVVLEQVFKAAGLEADDIGVAINRMQRYIEKAGVKKLGDEFFAIRTMAPEDQFLALANVINQIPSASQRAAAAMEIFGRGGGKLLSVFGNVQEMEQIRQAIGGQATLLQRNAAAFADVTLKLRLAGQQLRGFFVGVAAGALKFVEPLITKLSQLDFTAIGKKFGEALSAGVQAAVGFFKDPKLFGTALLEGMRAAALGLGNILIAVFNVAIKFFHDGMVAALRGLGDVIIGTLTQAFAKPIATFQAQIENVVMTMARLSDILSRPTTKLTPMQQLVPGLGIGPAFQGFQEGVKNFKDAASVLKEGTGPAAEARIAARAQEILASGGPKVGFVGEGQTATELLKQGSQELSEAFDAAAASLKSFKVEDVLGAGDPMKKAWDAAVKAIEEGSKALKDGLESTSEGLKRAFELPPIGAAGEAIFGAHPIQPSGPLVGATLGQQPGIMFAGGTPIFKEGSLLSASEQEKIVRAFIAAGGERPTAFPEAYHAVSAVDERIRLRAAKEEEKRQARVALGMENTNDLLKDIKDNTGKTAEAWAE